MKPRWPYGGFGHVGEIGPVLAAADGSGEGEIRANAALLFPQEYQQENERRRRWRPAPILETGVKVAGRRLLADDDGHVRVEVILSVPDEKLQSENVNTLLDGLLATTVDIVRIGRQQLIDAGFLLAQTYLRNSAKTAETSQFELLDTLLREGAGSPFLVLVSTPDADMPELPPGVPLDPPHPSFDSSAYSLFELRGHALAVWQLRGEGSLRSLLPHIRALCRIVAYQNEVSTLWSLQNDPGAVAPYLLDPSRTEYFLRRRGGQLRQKTHSGWSVAAVQSRAAHQIRVSVEEDKAFQECQEGLRKIVRRDVANDIGATLARIASDQAATWTVPMNEARADAQTAGNVVFVYVAGDVAGNVTTVGGGVGGDVTGGDKNVSAPPGTP
jgi:hypothetical protein